MAAGKDLHINFDTRVANPAGLVVTVGDLPQSKLLEIHRVPVDGDSGTIVIPGGAADQGSVHVSTATADGGASPATTTKLS